jgi:electron transfer flavoprotein alpha subunit
VADDLGAAGADRIVSFADAGANAYAPDLHAEAVRRVIEHYEPRYVLFPESALGGADLGRRVAALIGETAATRVWKLAPDRLTRRSGGGALDMSLPTPRIVLVDVDVGTAVQDERFEARPLEPPRLTAVATIRDRGLQPVDLADVDLEEADFIISAGNGVQDWESFHRLGRLLGAVEGGTRVVVDAGFLPRERQIGATGAIVTARCYLGFGISGAPQHLQGIASCEHVIAVNVDAHCDMMKRAQLAIAGDVQEIMQALLQRLGAGAARG